MPQPGRGGEQRADLRRGRRVLLALWLGGSRRQLGDVALHEAPAFWPGSNAARKTAWIWRIVAGEATLAQLAVELVEVERGQLGQSDCAEGRL